MIPFTFGADYYPEHWPRDRWETDAELMRALGLDVVRMGEFAWFKMEPEEGRFDFDWLDEAIALLASHGIKTILGTPTAAPAGLTCLKEVTAGRPRAAFSSFTSCQLLKASRKLIYPGRPDRI